MEHNYCFPPCNQIGPNADGNDEDGNVDSDKTTWRQHDVDTDENDEHPIE